MKVNWGTKLVNDGKEDVKALSAIITYLIDEDKFEYNLALIFRQLTMSVSLNELIKHAYIQSPQINSLIMLVSSAERTASFSIDFDISIDI
jgi:hypothetical protein